tara:strand:+ start:2385 stop:2570 length:186 start_codon:yes stop_codon:yes gene_type:complete
MEKIKIDTTGYLSKNIELTELEILIVINHWYLSMTDEIWQNEAGEDLEEVLDEMIEQTSIT